MPTARQLDGPLSQTESYYARRVARSGDQRDGMSLTESCDSTEGFREVNADGLSMMKTKDRRRIIGVAFEQRQTRERARDGPQRRQRDAPPDTANRPELMPSGAQHVGTHRPRAIPFCPSLDDAPLQPVAGAPSARRQGLRRLSGETRPSPTAAGCRRALAPASVTRS